MTRAWGLGASFLERWVDRMLQDFRHGQHGHHMTMRVPNFDTGFTEWGAVIHELPHQIAGAVFGFGQGVFEVHEFCTFLVAGHAAFVAKIYEIPGHRIVQSN